MATLDVLKKALRASARNQVKPIEVEVAKTSPAVDDQRDSLTDAQYSAGFDILLQGSTAYQDFIVPQISRLVEQYSHQVSVLEVGPGPKSVLGALPLLLRQRIRTYTAFEPNELYAAQLETCLSKEGPLPSLDMPPFIRREVFVLQDDNRGT